MLLETTRLRSADTVANAIEPVFALEEIPPPNECLRRRAKSSALMHARESRMYSTVESLIKAWATFSDFSARQYASEGFVDVFCRE